MSMSDASVELLILAEGRSRDVWGIYAYAYAILLHHHMTPSDHRSSSTLALISDPFRSLGTTYSEIFSEILRLCYTSISLGVVILILSLVLYLQYNIHAQPIDCP
jgi:hypothetical protein